MTPSSAPITVTERRFRVFVAALSLSCVRACVSGKVRHTTSSSSSVPISSRCELLAALCDKNCCESGNSCCFTPLSAFGTEHSVLLTIVTRDERRPSLSRSLTGEQASRKLSHGAFSWEAAFGSSSITSGSTDRMSGGICGGIGRVKSNSYGIGPSSLGSIGALWECQSVMRKYTMKKRERTQSDKHQRFHSK